MTETERVWAKIKRTAEKFAASGRSLTPREAEELVAKIARDENACPPREARTYFANELLALIEQYQHAVSPR